MMEIAVYGLPVRMPHWSFGVRYIYQLIQRHMGHSRLFEVVFPGNPGHAYLAASNGLAENMLVTAHVLGHADFSRNNLLFQPLPGAGERAHRRARGQSRAPDPAGHRDRTARSAWRRCSMQRSRSSSTSTWISRCAGRNIRNTCRCRSRWSTTTFRKRFASLDPAAASTGRARCARRRPVPPHPERDLLWFIANYAPDLESWERDIFLAVREESFYFYPVFATQIMNEGWASYWHARLLREADFIPQQAYLDAIKCHSDVVRPIAADQQVALSVNPYHLGFSMWEKIIETEGLEAARRIMEQDDDFGFVRNHLTRELADELGLFRYNARSDGQVKVLEHDLHVAARKPASPEVQLRRAERRGEARARGWHARAVSRSHGRRARAGSRAQSQSAGVRPPGVAAAGDPVRPWISRARASRSRPPEEPRARAICPGSFLHAAHDLVPPRRREGRLVGGRHGDFVFPVEP